LLLAANNAEMIAFNQEYAPEHLSLQVRAPRALLPDVRNAGTIFLGDSSSVAFGDYLTGANHVLPTATLARAYSGLSAFDFVRWTTYQEVTAAAAAALAPVTACLADAEGLPAHARAALLRGAT
jgi:histidinol dehydrogenase